MVAPRFISIPYKETDYLVKLRTILTKPNFLSKAMKTKLGKAKGNEVFNNDTKLKSLTIMHMANEDTECLLDFLTLFSHLACETRLH